MTAISGSAMPIAPQMTSTSEDQRLREAARALEGVFLTQMFQAMRATVPQGGMFESAHGQEMFTSMLDEQLAHTLAQRTENGLGDFLYLQLRERISGMPSSSEGAAPSGEVG